MIFHVVLEGGPELVDGAAARLVDEAEPDVVIERVARDGSTARFRISGDYALVNGHERRVYRYEEESDRA